MSKYSGHQIGFIEPQATEDATRTKVAEALFRCGRLDSMEIYTKTCIACIVWELIKKDEPSYPHRQLIIREGHLDKAVEILRDDLDNFF